MKLKFEVIQPEYVYLKLKPNNAIKNTNTHLIARTVANMYKTAWQTILKEDERVFKLFGRNYGFFTKWSVKRQGKIAYFVYMEKERIEFYFIIPHHYYAVIKERITGVWNGLTIEEVADIPRFADTATKYQMVYEKEDGLSLATDRKNNDLLNASLNVVDLMESGDKAGIIYNLVPISQNGFKYSYDSTLKKVKNGKPTDRNKTGIAYLLKVGITLIDTLIKDVAEALAGKSVKTDDSVMDGIIDRLNGGKQTTESTTKKIRGQIVDTQILVFAESKNGLVVNERSYANSIAQGFDVISGDNRLIKETYNGKFELLDTRIVGAKSNKMWDEELQNFIALPGRELLERYPFISRVETQETQLPKDLQNGIMCLGETTFRGGKQKAYLTEHEQFRKLMLLLLGPSRAGKTNLISHLCMDVVENDECVIMLDFIDRCQASRDVIRNFPEDKVLRIRFDDPLHIEGLGYNEVGISDDPFMQYDNAKKQMTNTLALVNAVNDGRATDTRLTPKMGRYLESACLIVYTNGGGVMDVFDTLTEHETRDDFIKRVPNGLNTYLAKYIATLRELDKIDKDGVVVGTRHAAIEGIIDRLSILNRNTYMELMLQNGVKNNINLVEEFQKNQVIVVEMPDSCFSTKEEKDVMTTYWLTKIWLALQIRSNKYPDNMKKVNLIVDEIYQVPNGEIFLATKLSQIAKYNMKPIIAAHYIKQLKYMRDELRSANPSYMLISGCDSDNYKELKSELYPFVEEDLLKLPTYHAMNYVKTKDGYAQFITKLPPKVSNRTRKSAPLLIE